MLLLDWSMRTRRSSTPGLLYKEKAGDGQSSSSNNKQISYLAYLQKTLLLTSPLSQTNSVCLQKTMAFKTNFVGFGVCFCFFKHPPIRAMCPDPGLCQTIHAQGQIPVRWLLSTTFPGHVSSGQDKKKSCVWRGARQALADQVPQHSSPARPEPSPKKCMTWIKHKDEWFMREILFKIIVPPILSPVVDLAVKKTFAVSNHSFQW